MNGQPLAKFVQGAIQVRYKGLTTSAVVGLLAILTACGGNAATTAPTAVSANNPTAVPQATVAIPADFETTTSTSTTTTIDLGVTGSGEIKAVQDADLVFMVQGTVQEVLVEEGQQVKKGDVLATLDLRPFQQALQQAQAGLTAAEAQQAALNEGATPAQIAAANAQVAQAQAALQQVLQGPKEQDIRNAESAVKLAETGLENTRNQLSYAKTQAEAAVQRAVEALTQAQAQYSVAKNNWDRVQDTGNDPNMPKSCDATGNCKDNKLNDPQRENYYAAFVAAEATMRQAELAVEQAVIAAEEARKAEILGIQTAEQQVAQSKTTLEKILLPADEAQVAAARAALEQAQAGRAQLNPSPKDSQKAITSASVEQALASLELARLNIEKAQLIAPFDGIVAQINVDPGDPSTTQGPAIQIVDISKLYLEVQINDIDIGKLTEGQDATIFADSLPGKTFTGKVQYIAPTATRVGNLRTYLVRVSIDDFTGLRAGMNARVEFPSNAE